MSGSPCAAPVEPAEECNAACYCCEAVGPLRARAEALEGDLADVPADIQRSLWGEVRYR